MNKYFFLFFFCIIKAWALCISSQEAQEIGEKIWKNECNQSIEGLTTWNQKENFASLGIGHFIWYSADQRERFEETFPSLLRFLEKKAIVLPDWLKSFPSCPWESRKEFYHDFQSEKMKGLREFLLKTKSLQAIFIANRLGEALPQMIESCSKEEKEKIIELFSRLAKSAKGLYALIDYCNFKGTGISSSERYKGQGWGLLQVLEKMSLSYKDPLEDFIKTAKEVLKQRVQNAPSERKEERWLKGWYNRLDTYLED